MKRLRCLVAAWLTRGLPVTATEAFWLGVGWAPFRSVERPGAIILSVRYGADQGNTEIVRIQMTPAMAHTLRGHLADSMALRAESERIYRCELN